jgi:DHA3 family macrolide efflux protein-like MFS transporter
MEASEGAVAAVGPVAAVAPEAVAASTRPRLWNASFYLLWQGQLVSALGDAVYAIALGFWVLNKTGSTAIMGTLMAASTLPRVAIAPFAGVLVDRADRKWMLVAMDAIRGLAVVLVGVAAFSGLVQVWMVLLAGIVIGIASAFFNPAVGSAIPDIVPRGSVVQANSAFALLQTGSGVLGNAAGGFLFQLLGAPLLFLANGISYLVAAAASLPIRVPKVRHEAGEFRFFRDLKTGLAFVWQYRGIRNMVLTAAALNFFAVIGITLFLPLFQRTTGLGSKGYGVVMAALTGGMFAGFLFTSAKKIAYRRRFAIFYACGLFSMACAAVMPALLNVPAMAGLAAAFGATNAVVNSFLSATLATAVPQNLRGKVFSFIGTIAGGLTPIAFAAAGGLAEVLPLRPLIAAAFVVTLFCFAPLALSRPTRRLIGYDPDADTLEEIR